MTMALGEDIIAERADLIQAVAAKVKAGIAAERDVDGRQLIRFAGQTVSRCLIARRGAGVLEETGLVRQRGDGADIG